MVTQTRNGKVLFEFYRPNVKQLSIAGDFNGWQQPIPMTRANDGWWRSQLELTPGTYRFRYMGDGNWFTDYAAFGVEPGPFGWNSVLMVNAVSDECVSEAPAPQRRTPAAVAAEPPADADKAPRPERPTPQRRQRQPRRRPALVGRS